MTLIESVLKDHVFIDFGCEAIDTSQPGTLFQLSLTSAISQSESESIFENVKWLYRKRAERGIYIPRKGVNFGYNTDNNTFVPDGNARYVKLMFERYAEGRSLTEIENELKGMTDQNGNPIKCSRIRSILRNEIYVGDREFGKIPQKNVITGKPDDVQVRKYVRDHHEAIVSRKVWKAVQARLEREKKERERCAERRNGMLDVLRTEPDIKAASLAERVGVKTETAKNFIHWMKKKSILKKNADGNWAITD